MGRNKDIREAIQAAGVRHWQIAERLGIREETLSRSLRKELPPEEKAKIFAIIEELKGEN